MTAAAGFRASPDDLEAGYADDRPVDDRPAEGDVEGEGRRHAWRYGLLALAGLVLIASLVIPLIEHAVAQRRATVETATLQRLQALARSKAGIVETWIEGRLEIGRRLTGSELVRLFVIESGLVPVAPELAAPLAEQTPYMRRLLDEFARRHGLEAAALFNDEGRLVAGDRNASVFGIAPGEAAARRARAVIAADEQHHIDVRRRADGTIELDLLQRVPAPDAALTGKIDGHGVLMTRMALGERVLEVFEAGPLDLPGEEVRLVLPEAGILLNSGMRQGAAASGTDEPSFEARAPLEALDGHVVQRMTHEAALAPVLSFERSAIASAIAGVIVLISAACAFWWWQASRYQAAAARAHAAHAREIRAQKIMLASITASASDLIALCDRRGTWLHVNPALAQAAGSTCETMEGRRPAAFLPAATATLLRRLHELSQRSQRTVLEEHDEVVMANGRRHLVIACSPVFERGEPAGSVTVARDVTELMRERRAHERSLSQIIDALTAAIEHVDPWLSGHSLLVSRTATALGGAVGLGGDELRTLEQAARVSQIGKVFVPRRIVAKDGRHDEDEARIMRTHIEHAIRLLSGIDLTLPVARTLAQMHERLDGSGYPEGLTGDEIDLHGRILAIADVFAARVRPRSYRERMDPLEVVRWLKANPERYDARITALLEPLAAGLGEGASNGRRIGMPHT